MKTNTFPDKRLKGTPAICMETNFNLKQRNECEKVNESKENVSKETFYKNFILNSYTFSIQVGFEMKMAVLVGKVVCRFEIIQFTRSINLLFH